MSCIVVRWNPDRAKQRSAASRMCSRRAACVEGFSLGISIEPTAGASDKGDKQNEHSFWVRCSLLIGLAAISRQKFRHTHFRAVGDIPPRAPVPREGCAIGVYCCNHLTK